MFWLREVLNSAAEIQPHDLIDSDKPVQAGEIILGIVHDEMKQLHTAIKLAEIKLHDMLDEARNLSGVHRKKKFDEMTQAHKRIESLEMFFEQELRRRFNMTEGPIELRSGFQVVWCKGFSYGLEEREDV